MCCVDRLNPQSLAVVGDRFNCSRQAVNTLVNIFWDGLARFHEAQRVVAAREEVSPGWEKVTLMVPSQLIEKLRADIADLDTTKVRDTDQNIEDSQ